MADLRDSGNTPVERDVFTINRIIYLNKFKDTVLEKPHRDNINDVLAIE